MPPKLRSLSGSEVVKILSSCGFQLVSQRGSHMKLRRVTSTGERQTLTIPAHRELDTGTLRAILRQASKYIKPEELKEHFLNN